MAPDMTIQASTPPTRALKIWVPRSIRTRSTRSGNGAGKGDQHHGRKRLGERDTAEPRRRMGQIPGQHPRCRPAVPHMPAADTQDPAEKTA